MTTTAHDSSAATESASPPPAAENRSLARLPGHLVRNYAIVVGLVVVVGLFSALRPETYATIGNLGSVLQANSALALVAFGLMLPLIVGHFDLSVGAIAAFSGMLVAGLMSRGTVDGWVPAVLIVVAMSVIVGLANGLLVAYADLNSLVVTLATSSVLFGLLLYYSEGGVIYQGIPESFTSLGQNRPFGIPLPFMYVLVAAVVLWYLLYFRPLGRRLYAIGGSEDAARLTGIRVRPLVVGAFVVGAVLCGIGGVVQVAQVGSAAPTTGSEFLLPAFAACFLGETSVRRGYYNVWGTLTAVFLIAAGTTGLFMLGAEAYVQPLFSGLVLIGAVALARFTVLRRRAAA
ncbi:ABC transporter permease [Blastococcus sp. SYSU DS0617]